MTPSQLYVWDRCMPEPNSGCWIWDRAHNYKGYGVAKISFEGRVYTKAHRLSYEAFKSLIPDGLVVDHKCRNRACVNPDHLEPVTGLVNIRRGVGSPSTDSERCIRGHDPEHYRTYKCKSKPNGQLVCSECQRLWRAASRAKNAQR